jgi:AcrR family transcriptional regulator
MGRPRLHNEQTAEALLNAAERMIEADGPDALSLRRLAEQTQTTTRAVYSLFGSKDGLVVALAHRAFEVLGAGIRALPTSEDPAADLVEAGVVVFRRFAVEHPSLFRLAFQHRDTTPSQRWPNLRPTQQAALAGLHQRIARLGHTGGFADPAVSEATIEFHALRRARRARAPRAAPHRQRGATLAPRAHRARERSQRTRLRASTEPEQHVTVATPLAISEPRFHLTWSQTSRVFLAFGVLLFGCRVAGVPDSDGGSD